MPQILKPTPRSAPTTQGPRINQGNEPLWLHDPAAFGGAFRLFRMSFLLMFGGLALQFTSSLLLLTGVMLPVIMSWFKHLFALLSVGSGGLFLWGLWQMTQQTPLTQLDRTLRNVGTASYGFVVILGFMFDYLFFVILSKRLPVLVLIDYILLLFTVLGVGLTAWVVQQLLPKKRSSYVPVGVLLSLVLFVFFYPQLFFALAGRSVDLFQYFGLSYILVRSTTYLGWWLLLVVPLQKSLQRRQWRSTQSPEEEPSDADAAERHVESQENSAGGWGNIAVGTLLLMGGASGQFVLKGTNSSGGLAIFGLFLIGLGIFQMIRSKTSQTQ